MQNNGSFVSRMVRNGIALGAAGVLAGLLALPATADAAKSKRILSCKDAVSVLKGAGYKEIRTRSCAIPYTFTARKGNCAFFITVRASGDWTGLQADCGTIILDSSGF